MKLNLGRPGWLAMLAALAALAPASSALAVNYTWTGTAAAGNTNWFNTAGGTAATPSGQLNTNWNSPLSILGAGDSIEFNFGAPSNKTIATQNQVATVTNLSFAGSTSGQTAGSSALTVSGNITNSSSVLQTIGASGNLNMNGTSTIDVGTGGLTINKSLNGTGVLTAVGSGTLTLLTPSAFSGSLTTGSTAVNIVGNYGVASSSLVNNGASVVGSGNVSGVYVQTAGTGSFAGSVGNSTTGTVSFSGGEFFAGTVNLMTMTGGTATVGLVNSDSTISGGKLILPTFPTTGVSAVNFTVAGGEVTTSSGTDGVQFAEGLTVTGGTVNVLSVGSGGITSSGGTINFHKSGAVQATVLGPTTLGGQNFLVDGIDATVTFSDTLTMTSGNTWNLDFEKNDGINQVVDVGAQALTWGGNLSLNLTTAGTAANGSEWDFFVFGSQSGNLNGITLSSASEPAYQGLTFISATSSSNIFDQRYGAGVWLSDWTAGNQRFIFNQADGVLTVVPEPSTIVFAGIGAAMLGWQTWAGRRRKARMKLIEEHTRKLSEERGLV